MSEDFQTSPYVSPTVPPGPPQIAAVPPAQVKVLGILHLTFAGIGFLMLLGTLVMQQFNEKVWASQTQVGGDMAIQAEISREMMESIQGYTWLQQAGSAVLTVLLIVAGIGLLKRRRSGLVWSNAYAWSALALRISCVGYFLAVIVPKLDQIIERETAGKVVDSTFLLVTKASMVGGGVVGGLAYCIYPVLVLILLNRESVRRSLS
jgi:hypothetical protein